MPKCSQKIPYSNECCSSPKPQRLKRAPNARAGSLLYEAQKIRNNPEKILIVSALRSKQRHCSLPPLESRSTQILRAPRTISNFCETALTQDLSQSTERTPLIPFATLPVPPSRDIAGWFREQRAAVDTPATRSTSFPLTSSRTNDYGRGDCTPWLRMERVMVAGMSLAFVAALSLRGTKRER